LEQVHRRFPCCSRHLKTVLGPVSQNHLKANFILEPKSIGSNNDFSLKMLLRNQALEWTWRAITPCLHSQSRYVINYLWLRYCTYHQVLHTLCTRYAHSLGEPTWIHAERQ
jgi:hypothetical protein